MDEISRFYLNLKKEKENIFQYFIPSCSKHFEYTYQNCSYITC